MFTLLIAGGLGVYYFQNSGYDSERQGSVNEEIDIDSFSESYRPTQEDTNDTVPPPVPQDFAPGTALIRGTILSVEYTDDQPIAVEVQVAEVMGYGSSTPPLPVETNLLIGISNFLKANHDSRDQIQGSEKIQGLISFQQGMRGESDEKQRWSLVEL